MDRISRPRVSAAALLCLGLALAAPAATGCSAAADDDASEVGSESAMQVGGPFNLVGSFDGSQNFAFWSKTMTLARGLSRETRRPVHFTYFVNGAHFRRIPSGAGSECGAAISDPERAARLAIAQQAINEGHEIANHSMYHHDGGDWTADQWAADLDLFDAFMGGKSDPVHEAHLFWPVRDASNAPVFPKWNLSGAPRALGAACVVDGDCDSGMCTEIAEGKRFCTQSCNATHQCGAGFSCGGAPWRDDFTWGSQIITDICMPNPVFPVVHDGKELFRADGSANPDMVDPSPDGSRADKPLKPYKMVGFRAPYLSAKRGTALWDALKRHGYLYSSSAGDLIGKEAQADFQYPTSLVGSGRGIWEFPLTPAVNGAALPADSVYRAPPSCERMSSTITPGFDVSPRDACRVKRSKDPVQMQPDKPGLTASSAVPASTMRADYKEGILARYAKRSDAWRMWGILTHFSNWETDNLVKPYSACKAGWKGLTWESQPECGESYFNAFADTITWAARGCPKDGSGEKQCGELAVLSYRDVLPTLKARPGQ